MADKNGEQHKYLNWITVLTFISFLFISLITLFFSHQVFLALLFFLIANYFYQFSFVFYNALLHYIAPRQLWGRISGIGQAGNWLGQIAGLLITLPFASGAVYLVGEVGRAQTFLPATIIFFILSLPMLLYFKIPKQEKVIEKISIQEEYKNYWGNFKNLVREPNMGLFLLSYFFFNDAIITSATNFPIYLQRVFAVSDNTKSMLLLSILATSVIGAFCSGWVADKMGLKKTLMIVLGSFIVILPGFGLTSNFSFFVLLAVLMGFMLGAIWTVTRTAMTILCPKEKLNFGFSFYTLAERASTLIGPLSWGLVTLIFVNQGAARYRIAVSSMAVFVAIGIFFLRKVKMEKELN
jgi:UMF1 family MFS transporter